MKNRTSYVISALLAAALLTSCSGGNTASAGISDITSTQSVEESGTALSAPKIELDVKDYGSERTAEIPIFKGDENDAVVTELNKRISEELKSSYEAGLKDIENGVDIFAYPIKNSDYVQVVCVKNQVYDGIGKDIYSYVYAKDGNSEYTLGEAAAVVNGDFDSVSTKAMAKLTEEFKKYDYMASAESKSADVTAFAVYPDGDTVFFGKVYCHNDEAQYADYAYLFSYSTKKDEAKVNIGVDNEIFDQNVIDTTNFTPFFIRNMAVSSSGNKIESIMTSGDPDNFVSYINNLEEKLKAKGIYTPEGYYTSAGYFPDADGNPTFVIVFFDKSDYDAENVGHFLFEYTPATDSWIYTPDATGTAEPF